MNILIITSIAATFLMVSSRSQAVPLEPYLGAVRTEITNQLNIANSNAPANKKLISTLNGALKRIDKPGVATLGNDVKVLSLIASALSKSSASNVFYGPLNAAVDNYLGLLFENANNGSNRLANTFPSRARTSAERTLTKIYEALAAANAEADLKLAARLLARTAPKFATLNKQIEKAEKVGPPPAGVEARVSGATSWSFKSTAAVASQVGNAFIVNSGQAVLKGRIGQRTITLTMADLQAGLNVISLGGSVNAALVSEAYQDMTGAAYGATSGTVRVTWVPGSRHLSGTFSFEAEDEENAGRKITVTGSFSATAL